MVIVDDAVGDVKEVLPGHLIPRKALRRTRPKTKPNPKMSSDTRSRTEEVL